MSDPCYNIPEGERIEVPNIGYYSEVLACDLKSDNTTGTLPVTINNLLHASHSRHINNIRP